MFSSRTDWNVSPNRLYRLLAEKKSRGEQITDLTVSNPTLCEFSYPKKEILSALSNESALVYQPHPRGLLSARISIAEYYARQGISINPEQIVLTSGTSEAYNYLFRLLCNPQDGILAPQPSYPLFEFLCRISDIRLEKYQLAYDGEWHPDFNSIENAIRDGAKAIVLVSPNNPTGSYLKQDEFNRICNSTVERKCAIILDEVFSAFTLKQVPGRAKFLSPPKSGLFFSLNGISKLMGLPQLKLSWIIVRGDQAQVIDALDRLDIIADTFLSVNTPVQTALRDLFKLSDEIGSQIVDRVRTNYNQCCSIFSGTSVTVMKVEGGWNAILQLPNRFSDLEWAERILNQMNVLIQPGYFFDMEQESCIMLSLLTPADKFNDCVRQLSQFIENS